MRPVLYRPDHADLDEGSLGASLPPPREQRTLSEQARQRLEVEPNLDAADLPSSY